MREGWEYKKLGEVALPKSKIDRASKIFAQDDEIRYIDISSIDNCSFKIKGVTKYSMRNAPSRAQQRVLQNDIVVSTVRPNLKNIAIIDRDEENLVASSGFCVLRFADDIERNYFFHYITSDVFTAYLVKHTSGANYPAVKDSVVRDAIVPIPPKSVQLDIVSELDQINELIRLKKEQLKDYDNLAQSIFYEMFGDPVENEKGWEVKKLGDFSRIVTGNTPSRKTPEYYNGKFIEWIKSDNISDSTLYPTLAKEYLSEVGAGKGRLAEEKEILVTCIAGSLSSIGTSCILNRKVAFNQQINAITCLADVDAIYLRFWVMFAKKYIQEFATTGMKHIVTKGVFETIPVPLPPIPLQQEFSSRISQVEWQKAEVSNAIADLETLLASRMQYWFE